MANLVKHRFVSGKTDGPDATQVQPSAWNDGHVFAGGNAGDLLTRDPTDATYGAAWQPPPAWIDVPYNAANFAASGPMTWTVEAADQVTFAYVLNGHIMTIAFWLYNTTIAGTADYSLFVTIPAGKVATKLMEAVGFFYWGTPAPGQGAIRIATAAGDGRLQLMMLAGGPFPLATNLAYLNGQITIAI